MTTARFSAALNGMMRRSPVCSVILILSLFLASCGTGKKLKACMADSDQLRSQNASLTTKVNDLTNANGSLQKQVSDLTTANQSLSADYARYKVKCEDARARLRAARAILLDQAQTMQKVREKIATALADFQSKGVDVSYKNGLVYVTMQEGLLYKSGSANLGEGGKKALGSLASVLNDYPDLKVIVVGHTDNVQFKSGSDNWSLSTERANGVVRVLRDQYKVNPERLTSAGKGKYGPVADNNTADGRAKNRRTDIILNPDLDKLWESAEQGDDSN